MLVAVARRHMVDEDLMVVDSERYSRLVNRLYETRSELVKVQRQRAALIETGAALLNRFRRGDA